MWKLKFIYYNFYFLNSTLPYKRNSQILLVSHLNTILLHMVCHFSKNLFYPSYHIFFSAYCIIIFSTSQLKTSLLRMQHINSIPFLCQNYLQKHLDFPDREISIFPFIDCLPYQRNFKISLRLFFGHKN